MTNQTKPAARPISTTDNANGAPCACGCGEHTARTIRLLPEQDRDTAAALRWAESSIRPMRVPVSLIEGHSIPDEYVNEAELQS